MARNDDLNLNRNGEEAQAKSAGGKGKLLLWVVLAVLLLGGGAGGAWFFLAGGLPLWHICGYSGAESRSNSSF